MKYVLFYESAEDIIERAQAIFPEHKAHLDAFHAQGSLLMVGPFGDPQAEGSMSVFTTREAAEAFASADPFVTNGLVRRWYVRDWNEVLTP